MLKHINRMAAVGFKDVLKKIFCYPYILYNHFFIFAKKRKFILSLTGNEEKFTQIYTLNYWDNSESVSGSGSTLSYTENLRHQLPDLLRKFSIESIFDAPCGDFNWMQQLLKNVSVEYIGGDIVQQLIARNVRYFSDDHTNFLHIDLTTTAFPDADLMLCRDCLFHLSYEDTEAVLRNFIKSGIAFLLTTTHINRQQFSNKDITTGDYRLIDLFSAPYNFPRDVLYSIEDWQPPEPERVMCLWTRDQILNCGMVV